MTLMERIRLAEVRMQATRYNGEPPEWAGDMDGWRCTLRKPGGSFTVTYWMGLGHGGRRPDVVEVMECVLSDAVLVDGQDEEDFARSMGYGIEEARPVFGRMVKQTERLRRWLGDEADAWLYETERV